MLRQRAIEGLIVIGGNGSLAGVKALLEDPTLATRVIGIPASIDNDVGYTALSIGVDTAMNTIVDACDKISDTASSHDRTFIVEVMGRDSGYLAMTAGVASAANAVLFRELGESEDAVVDRIVEAVAKAQARPHRNKRVLVIKGEGIAIPNEALKTRVDARLAERFPREDPIETRVAVLGHIVRGGRPSALDRVLASRLALAAVRALLDGKTKVMAAWSADLADATGERTALDPHCSLIDLDDVLAETERLRDGSSSRTRWRNKVFQEIADVIAG